MAAVVNLTVGGNAVAAEYATASFESQLNATPGTFEITVPDRDRTLSFTTGQEISFSLDGVQLFGGYVTQVRRGYALPVVDTTKPVHARQWILTGVDYNILFDKRVLRRPANYLAQLPLVSAGAYDGATIKTMISNYLDLSGFTTTQIQNVTILNPDGNWAFKEQGTTWRDQMADIARKSGAVWYIDAGKNILYKPIEDSVAAWGFSDVPNKRALDGKPANVLATYGFREIDVVEDGSSIINDAFVWGGSQFSGTSGGTVFSRYSDSGSISLNGRWQFAEQHFGDPNYASQREVDDRTKVIVNGSPTTFQPGQDGELDSNRGLRFSQWNIKLTWFDQDVPTLSGVKQHLRPGDLTTFALYVLGTRVGSSNVPLIQTLPLRQIRLGFPALDPSGKGIVRFEGYWGLQLSDPFTLWQYLNKNKSTIASQVSPVAVSDSGTTSSTYGSFAQFAPTPTPNGTNKVFALPNSLGYISGTLQVYRNRLIQESGVVWTELDPAGGTFEFATAPASTDSLYVVCRTT